MFHLPVLKRASQLYNCTATLFLHSFIWYGVHHPSRPQSICSIQWYDTRHQHPEHTVFTAFEKSLTVLKTVYCGSREYNEQSVDHEL